LSLEEFETAAYVVERLKSYGFTEIYTGIGVTGVIGIMRGDSDESILLRADMDALPINESNELPFKSCKPNVMHACVHPILNLGS
jgi:metal-dependent amidase/aminoacylase/carboxypeptidase family protein